MSLSVLIKYLVSFFRFSGLIIINIFMTVVLFFIVTSSIAYLTRFDQDAEKLHLHVDAYEECIKSSHFRISVDQAKLMGKSNNDLFEYCRSRSMFTDDWVKGRTYWDYHYYSQTALNTPDIGFNDTRYFNSRRVPCSKDVGDKKNLNIWMFGGSTMQNMETSDSYTIANTICEELSRANDISLMNFGVGSFYSEMEIHKFLNLVKFTIAHDQVAAPDLVFFYNGYNDSERLIWGKWSGLPKSISDRFSSTLYVKDNLHEALYWFLKAAEDYYFFLSDDRLNLVSTAIGNINDLVSSKKTVRNEMLEMKVDKSAEKEGVLVSSHAYLNDQRSLSGICRAAQIKCIIILQPLLSLRDNPVGEIEANNYSNFEEHGINELTIRFYEEVKSRIYDFENTYYKVIDLSQVTNAEEYIGMPFFYDFGHTGYYASEILGKEISRRVLERDLL